jgi:hypothetical protein
MKNKTLILMACIWLTALMAVQANPTMAGRLKSYANGKLTIEQEDKSLRTFLVTDRTSVKYMGRNSSLAALPVGCKISIEVIGSLGSNPMKAGKIVDWSSSSEIVAVGAKAPYYTEVGKYATTSGSGGVPDGAPVGQHAASHTLGAVAHGGSINQPTPENHSVAPTGAPSSHGQSMGQSSPSTQYMNQGDSTTAPLEMLNINPYGNGQPTTTGGQPNAGMNQATNPGMYGTDPTLGMNSGMYGNDPSMNPAMQPGMQPGMDPSMYGMDPSMGMSNPYSASNLGAGQSGSLMGITGDDEGDYSAGGDMMGLNDGYGGGENKITGSILQVDMQRGLLTIQSFTNPQPQKVIMGPGSSASPDLLIPGKMIQITGRPTPNGFQAIEIQAAPGF